MKRAIIHVDGDAFFASCEQALHPEYKHKPVITGLERGIVSAASYEAKKFGIKRGVPLWEVKKLCPQAIIVPSDYENYSLFSKRMFAIIRRYTSEVEEYGIDEAFADLTGLDTTFKKSYPALAHAIKCEIERELNITVSIGLSVSKVLAKIGSKFNKPSGFVVISKNHIAEYTRRTPCSTVWGIGPSTTTLLKKHSITTAYQLAQRSEQWIKQHLAKPYQEIWHELNGRSVLAVHHQPKTSYQSMSKTKTFTPASTHREYVLAQLSKNVENVCIKARRYMLGAQDIAIFLKTQGFRYHSIQARLNRVTAFPTDLVPIIHELFNTIFQATVPYRATGITLYNLRSLETVQLNLFESPLRIEQQSRIYRSVDALSQKYGKHTVFLGSSMLAHTTPDTRQQQRTVPKKLRRDTTRKYVGIPLLQQTVR